MALLRMRPSRGLDAARLDEEVAHAAPLICTWAGGLLLVEGLAHLLILSPAYRAGMTWLTVGVGVLLLILRGVLQVRAVPRGCGHVVAFLLGVLLLVPGIALLVWSHEARHVTNLMIIVLGGGVLFLSFRWLVALLAVAWAGYVAAVVAAPADQQWVHFGSAFVGVSVLALLLVAVHLRLFERLFSREAALASTLADLRRSNEALEQFAYVVSHDLQAPIRAISGYAAVLRDEVGAAPGEAGRDIVDRIEASARHMGDLVRDLVEYGRVGSRGAEFRPVPLDQALDRALSNLAGELEAQKAEVQREPLPTVQGDEVQLVQLFQNLIANAIKFHGAAPPRVRVSALREGRDWAISVADNGIGIPPEFHERVFRVFERLHAGTTYPGTGIGLATCKRVVERHGGTIHVDSHEGAGATFTFRLPARPA